MKVIDFVKLGFGFYVGYELAHTIDEALGKIVVKLMNK